MDDDELAALLACRGLRLPRHLRGTARKRLRARLADLGLDSLEEYREYLRAHPDEGSTFDAMCRVTISRFYRDSAVFDALAPMLRPGARVWSAGCASGEEAYTVAILEPNAEILATDADERVLDRARRGCYPRGCLRELRAPLRDRAFVRRSDEASDYCIRDEYRRNVTFRREDLRETMPGGPFDIILCRNLAFTYFDEATQRRIAEELMARLADGGVLVVGAREALPEGVVLREGVRVLAREGNKPSAR